MYQQDTLKIIKKFKNKRKYSKLFRKLLKISGVFLIIFVPIVWIWLYYNIIKPLPQITPEKLEDLSLFAQSSTITDRNWIVLYKIFEENRKQIKYKDISPNVINAVVATEDATFWTNDWINYKSLVRAVLKTLEKKLIWKWRVEWASTVTQQLVRWLLLTRDRTIIRKLKEVFLIKKLNRAIDEYIKLRNPWISSKELFKKRKEMIMELYLNMVFLWNNAYWVESAAQTYFWKSAKDLSIVEWAILAGIIQAPGRYNPYKNKIWRLSCNSPLCQWTIWWLVVLHNDELVPLTWEFKKIILKKVTDKIQKLNLKDIEDNIAFNKFLNWNLDFTISYNWEIYSIKYLWWRKDSVLIRMYKEWYITPEQLKQAFIEWLDIKLHTKKVNIKAPHFVFWVKELLETDPKFKKLWITEDTLLKGGLTIRTSLDYKLQQFAVESMHEQNIMQKLHDKKANNRAMLYIDSKNWDVLVYVWSLDYNNEKIGWRNDMIQAYRQPWSTMKPLIYAYWFQNLNITLDTPVYDLPTKIWNKTPHNDDWKFMWLMPLRKALAWSRNIPAIKMYFADWEEQKLKPYLHKLWIKAVKNDRKYWYSLALWAAEIPMIQMAQAYAHLSTLWSPAKIDPILEIKWPDWQLIYKKEVKKLSRVLEKWPVFLVWKILSDDANMPPWWPLTLRVYWFPNATKSWTSNMKKNWKSYSRDWWLVLYTPSKVLIAWAWNTDWSPMIWYWWSLNGPLFKSFFKKLQQSWYVVKENIYPTQVSSVYINKVSGKLASSKTPERYKVYTMGYNKKLPVIKDDGFIWFKYDQLCAWLVSDFTPESDIKQWYIRTNVNSFIPSQRDVKDIKLRLDQGHIADTWSIYYKRQKNVVYNLPEIFTSKPKFVCEERVPKEDLTIKLAITSPKNWQEISKNFDVKFAVFDKDQKISRVVFFIDDIKLKTINYDKKIISDLVNLQLSDNISLWKHKLTLVAIDVLWYSNKTSINVNLWKDTKWPIFDSQNVIIKQLNTWYNVSLSFQDNSKISNIKIIVDWKILNFYNTNRVDFVLKDLVEVWYFASDINWNISKWVIDLSQFK